MAFLAPTGSKEVSPPPQEPHGFGYIYIYEHTRLALSEKYVYIAGLLEERNVSGNA